jgi:hypothetical protein
MTEYLTEQELLELKNRPVQQEYTDFTKEQLKVRVEIAKKIISPFKAEIPVWTFYKSQGRLLRICGLNEHYLLECHIGWTDSSIFDAQTDEKQPSGKQSIGEVSSWSEDEKRYIKLNNSPGLFADPLGFLLLDLV